MKIAVTFENGNVFAHFGHTKQFVIFEVENKEIKSSFVLDTNGSGHSALATLLKENRVTALICGGIGSGAKTALAQNGILVFGGVDGNATEAVEKLLDGKLEYSLDVTCSHHHDHSHSCGENNSCSEECHCHE